MDDAMIDVFDGVIRQLELGWYEPHEDTDVFSYYPLPMREFLRCLTDSGATGKFLDLGCGIGTKLMMASLLGWKATGVEIREDYAQAARRICPHAQIHVADARGFPVAGYDVVYSYRLFVGNEDQAAFDDYVISNITPGTFYVCPGSNPLSQGRQVAPCVWQAT